MTGKDKCNILKAVRMKIASMNGIEYIPKECPHEGPCPGTCPACEAEAEELMSKLFEKEVNGTPIKVDTNILAELDNLACGSTPTNPVDEDECTEIAELGYIMPPGFIEGEQGVGKGRFKGTLLGDIIGPNYEDDQLLGDI
jgi:hypothetical protein